MNGVILQSLPDVINIFRLLRSLKKIADEQRSITADIAERLASYILEEMQFPGSIFKPLLSSRDHFLTG